MLARPFRLLNFIANLKISTCSRREAELLLLSHLRNVQASSSCYCQQSFSGTFPSRDSTSKINQSNRYKRWNKESGRPWFNKSEFPPKSKHDPDKFGTLAEEQPGFCPLSEDLMPDDINGDDDEEFVPVLQVGERPTVGIHQLKELVREGKLKQALTMFRNDIVKEKKAQVIPPMYIILIGACSRVGYTKMAFKLFKEMRDRGYSPTGATITALFNACAECPFPEYGLQKAYQLCGWIEKNGFCLNSMSYHAKMKAFGRCGDLERAFQVIDEMMEQRLPLSSKGFSFLLMACISNKEAGLAHAIQVIRKMRKYHIARDVYIYNLLLRAVRDCEVGPPEVVQELLKWNLKDFPKPKNEMNKLKTSLLCVKSIKSIDDKKDILNQNEDVKLQHKQTNASVDPRTNSGSSQSNESEENNRIGSNNTVMQDPVTRQEAQNTILPNLLDPYFSTNTDVLDIRNTERSQNRLALIGGMDGILALMASENINPDIKTFTLLLDSIPQTLEAENKLLDALHKVNVNPDVDFFNLIMKRRMFRHEFKEALSVLLDINGHGLMPDIVTFGVLATGCNTLSKAKKLLEDMKHAGFQPNIEIVGALMRNAVTFYDYWYVIHIMNVMKSDKIKPDNMILDLMEKSKEEGERMRAKKDRGEDIPHFCGSESFDKSYRTFLLYYNDWLKGMEVEVPQHPWKQYTPDKQITMSASRM